MTNQIGFKDQTIILDEDPKRGVCNGCRYVVGTIGLRRIRKKEKGV